MNNSKKYLWCPKCGCYPDKVKGVFDSVTEIKEWCGKYYELQDVDYGDSQEYCGECNTLLEVKSQEDSDVTPMPKVQGEVSEDEDTQEDRR